MNINKNFETIAAMARKMKTGVNLGELCKGKKIEVTNFRLNDGSTLKLLEGANEVDCLVMKNGKVLTAQGTKVKNELEASKLASRIIEEKIANRSDIVESNITTKYDL